jgi:hypothetical protein
MEAEGSKEVPRFVRQAIDVIGTVASRFYDETKPGQVLVGSPKDSTGRAFPPPTVSARQAIRPPAKHTGPRTGATVKPVNKS